MALLGHAMLDGPTGGVAILAVCWPDMIAWASVLYTSRCGFNVRCPAWLSRAARTHTSDMTAFRFPVE
eukprot:1613357-Amphidinium_carterae.1